MRLTYILAATVASASAALVLAQNPQPTQNQVAVPPRALYSMADVARSLEVSDRQRERLDRLTQQTVSDYQARYNRLADVPEAERAARTAELNRQYEAALLKGTRDILDEKQANRYQQLYYQYGGWRSAHMLSQVPPLGAAAAAPTSEAEVPGT